MNVKRLVWLAAVAAPLFGCTEQPEPESPTAQEGPSAPPEKQAARPAERGVDAEADALLRRMSDYLGNLQSFSFSAEHTLEVVLQSGEKRQYAAGSRVSIRRPNKLRSERQGEFADVALLYDGKTLTLYGKRKNMYAQAAAPSTIDETIDFARQRLDLEAPGADLLYSKPYDILMEDVVSGTHVGAAVVHGVPCQHLAYRGRDVDWQLWIQDGPAPLPLRYVITSKDVKGEPEFAVEIHDWNTTSTLPDDLFTFVPPPDAERIEFLGLLDKKPSKP